MRNGKAPDSITIDGEPERMVARVGLRQLEWLDGPSEILTRWRRVFDR
ncbi:MAG: hypothetical protein GKS00_11075 [Alphaproteobacteria bacterium]|nr:hypothetical protein [Alphaproteobacteria bacterium]